jgi:hypothetical protein
MDKWIEEVFERSFASLPEADRAIAYGELMSTHASGVVKLIAAAKSSCDSAREAAAALDRQDASRSKVQSLSNALSTLLVCYANILVVDPESIDANNTGFPLKVRQRLRESTTSLQNAIDEWAQLPEDCRQPIEEMGNSLMGLETESPNDDGETPRTKLEASLAWWKAKGFTVWVEVQTNTTEGNGHGYKIKFDEAPAIAWFGVRSDRAKRFEFSVTDPEGDKVEQTGGITHSDITWHGVELTKDGEYSITFTTDDAVDYPFEFVGVLRGSPFVTRRKWVRETNELKMFKEIETWSIYVDAGGRQKVTIDGTGYRSLLVACDDVDRNDIDIEVVDPDGDVVSKDVEDNPWPSAIIESPMQGEYTVRVLNTSRKDVIVDLIFFAVKMGH